MADATCDINWFNSKLQMIDEIIDITSGSAASAFLNLRGNMGGMECDSCVVHTFLVLIILHYWSRGFLVLITFFRTSTCVSLPSNSSSQSMPRSKTYNIVLPSNTTIQLLAYGSQSCSNLRPTESESKTYSVAI
jgi:hypothetical protein